MLNVKQHVIRSKIKYKDVPAIWTSCLTACVTHAVRLAMYYYITRTVSLCGLTIILGFIPSSVHGISESRRSSPTVLFCNYTTFIQAFPQEIIMFINRTYISLLYSNLWDILFSIITVLPRGFDYPLRLYFLEPHIHVVCELTTIGSFAADCLFIILRFSDPLGLSPNCCD